MKKVVFPNSSHIVTWCLCLLLGACTGVLEPDDDRNPDVFNPFSNVSERKDVGTRGYGQSQALNQSDARAIQEFFEPGTDHVASEAGLSSSQITHIGNSKTLQVNFVNTPLQEFARAVFEDVLKSNYVIDPNLQGAITLRTSRSITQNQLINMMKQALATNNARLVKKDGAYQILASGGGGNALPTRILPLRYVSAGKLATELKALAPGNVQIIPSKRIGAIILKGNLRDLDAVASIVSAFDIDQMKGMSFGLVAVKNASSASIADELREVLSAQGSSDTKILNIARMNALLVVSKRAAHLRAARTWIGRLDQKNPTAVQSYVYSVQNRRAEELAKVLQSAFIAPQGNGSNAAKPVVNASATIPALSEQLSNPVRPVFQSGQAEEQQTKITADAATNSLIIFATPQKYKLIRAALHKLDIVPLQVLIEATIAEVRLNNDLRHGVSWYLKSKNIGFGYTSSKDGSVSPQYPGMNLVVDVPQGKLVVSALEGVTDVDIISTPSMTVLDNQTAKLQVGDQVPIATQSARSTQSGTAPVVNTIELKDTGIILSVTPRVNSSGLVVLDIVQEASDVVATTSSGIDSPTIRQRKFESSIAVKDGRAIVLGGLISRRNEKGESGVPIAKDIPVLGNLFKNSTQKSQKNELIIIIRPTVIRNQHDILSIASEFHQKMQGISSLRP